MQPLSFVRLLSLGTLGGAIAAGALLLPGMRSGAPVADRAIAALAPEPGPGGASPRAEAAAALARQPLAFVENRGQWEHPARYVARIGPMTMFLQEDGWTFTLEAPGEDGERTRGVAVEMTFEGAAGAELAPERRLPGAHHYFLGNDPAKWRSGVPRYGAVRYRGIRPGVDVLAREGDGHFEYDLLLAPGAALEEVEIAVEGASGLRLDGDGALVIETALGPVRMPPPPSWEEGPSGERSPIPCRYVLRDGGRFGFEAPGRRPGWALVVDPGLVWSTYLGGVREEHPHASPFEPAMVVAVDAGGAATVGGWTRSVDFPTTKGAYDTVYSGGGFDAFVARLDPSKSGKAQLVWSTYLGGTSVERVRSLALDAQGVITVAGRTISADFPTKNAYDATHNGSSDVFVARLDPSKPLPKDQLVWSTFLGGAAGDVAQALALDAAGAATIAGKTTSGGFPTKNAYDATHNGGVDGFVARLDPTKTGTKQLVWSTFLGGSSEDRAYAVAVDAQGAATVAGLTRFPFRGFPTTPGAFDTSHNGSDDGFVARLDPTKTGTKQLVWSTFLGGSSLDRVFGLALDAQGVATVSGRTDSSNYPTTAGAYDTSHNGGRSDAFVTRLDPSKSGQQQLVWSTFLGGSGGDHGFGLVLDARNAPILAGWGNVGFPTTKGAFDTTHNGRADGFVARLSPKGSKLEYSTFIGGKELDFLSALAVDARGVVTVAGSARSTDFPTTKGAFDRTYNGGTGDVFVARIELVAKPAPKLTGISPASVKNHDPAEVTLTGKFLFNTRSVTAGGRAAASFRVLSEEEVRFELPDPARIGARQPVTVTTDTGKSNPLSLDVVGTHPAVLEGPPFALRGFASKYEITGDKAWSSLLLVSTSNAPSRAPGVVSLDIGNNFTQLWQVASLSHDSRGYVSHSLHYPKTLPVGTTLYFQAVTWDPKNLTLPIESSNSLETRVIL